MCTHMHINKTLAEHTNGCRFITSQLRSHKKSLNILSINNILNYTSLSIYNCDRNFKQFNSMKTKITKIGMVAQSFIQNIGGES